MFEAPPLFLVLLLLELPSTSFTLWSDLFVFLSFVCVLCMCVCVENKLSTILFFTCLPCRRLRSPCPRSSSLAPQSSTWESGSFKGWLCSNNKNDNERLPLLLIIRIMTNEFCFLRFTERRQDYDRIL